MKRISAQYPSICWRGIALGALAATTSLACGAVERNEPTQVEAAPPKVETTLTARPIEQVRAALVGGVDWASMGLEAPELTPIGPIGVDHGPVPLEMPGENDAADPGPAVAPEPSLAFLAVDVLGGYAYKLQFKKGHFDAAPSLGDSGPGAEVDQAGRVIPDYADPELDHAVPKAWSGGTDSRIRRAEVDGFAENLSPFKWIGALSGGCTGSFIGRKMILTAAHCVLSASGAGGQLSFNRGGELAFSWDLVDIANRPKAIAHNFFPRMDQGAVATGYASVKAEFHLTPLEYSNGTCTNITNCNRYDFAMILTSGPNPAGIPAGGSSTHPGYFGWRTANPAWYQANTLSFRGYPGCGTSPDWLRASRPGGWNSNSCSANTLYGDTQACTASSGTNPIQGFNSEYLENCDGSPGMSGSPFYDSSSFIVGVYSQESCAGNPGNPPVYNTNNPAPAGPAPSCVGTANPGAFTTITPDRANMITVYRGTTWNQWP